MNDHELEPGEVREDICVSDLIRMKEEDAVEVDSLFRDIKKEEKEDDYYMDIANNR